MKNKTARRDELRRCIQDARQQSKHYCYGPELKRDIVAYATECRAEGTSIRAVARELGLSSKVLPQWYGGPGTARPVAPSMSEITR